MVIGLLLQIRKVAFTVSLNLQNQVQERRAAMLIGLPWRNGSVIRAPMGLGRLETSQRGERRVFTYEQLRRVGVLAAQCGK